MSSLTRGQNDTGGSIDKSIIRRAMCAGYGDGQVLGLLSRSDMLLPLMVLGFGSCDLTKSKSIVLQRMLVCLGSDVDLTRGNPFSCMI
ncbi:hypothetical protein LSAT2_032201, partial [Lamellibrachia satsuma]